MHQLGLYRLEAGLCTDPLVELTVLSLTPICIRGNLLLRKGYDKRMKGDEREVEGKAGKECPPAYV